MAPGAAFAANADLAITKIADRTTVPIGENIRFTITLTNLGPGAATDVVFGDPLPDPLNLVSFSCSEGTVISSSYCSVDLVPAGHQVTIDLVATPITNPAPEEFDFENTAFILASGSPDPQPSNNTASVMMHLEMPASDVQGSGAARPNLKWTNAANGVVRFELALQRPEAQLELAIFDVRGRRQAILIAGNFAAGTHVAQWGSRDADARPAPGIYLVRCRTSSGATAHKFLLGR
jgi:uncharacterized repeat protein (TIGR01451 family)